MKNSSKLMVCVLFAMVFSLAFCSKPDADGGGVPSEPISLKPVFSGADLIARFGTYYEPVKSDVDPKVHSYSLPLDQNGIQNFNAVMNRLMAGREGSRMLLKNGFASVPYGRHEDIAEFYNMIKDKEVPVFITSDSVLHLYHIQFDETLRQIEEDEFYPDIKAFAKVFTEELESRAKSGSGIEREGYLKGLAFFAVGLKLLDPDAKVPNDVRELVEEEIRNIEKHEGFKKSAIFMYREDYSQYVPRGHYTRSEILKRYFKGFMWFGRLTMLIKGAEKHGPDAMKDALISVEEAQAQTIAAATIAGLLSELKIGDRLTAQVWERIYTVTAYYVGLADDLTPQDYRSALREVFGDNFNPGKLADPETFRKFQTEIAKKKPPAIYSGTGESGVNMDLQPDRALSAEQLDKILGKTTGFRLMGQRYIPDSYIMGQMVAPVIGKCNGPPVFTTVEIPDFGPIRGFPRGLDVMAVLGSERALEVLGNIGDSNYEKYDNRMRELKEEFGAISQTDWNRNLYWSWLYALKGLMEPTQSVGWPTFMQTDAWADKQLNAALGSWSSLRHDTILYAKQSYTPTITAASAQPYREPPKPVVGYVEPVPEFYARLVGITNMTIRGLEDLDVLDDVSIGRLKALGEIIARLQAISEKELKNGKLTQDDYYFIKNFGDHLTAVVAGADAKAMKTTLVADVHTDQNTKQVLEEATGHIRLLMVAYKLPEGHILVGAGPVFSYYEFKHPMADRLTDEKWRKLLVSDDAPKIPEWTGSFSVF